MPSFERKMSNFNIKHNQCGKSEFLAYSTRLVYICVKLCAMVRLALYHMENGELDVEVNFFRACYKMAWCMA